MNLRDKIGRGHFVAVIFSMSDNSWSARDRAVAAAFFLLTAAIMAFAIYWSGSLSGYQDGRSAEADTSHQAQAKDQVVQACAAQTGEALVECVFEATKATEESKRNEQDLDAQQGMERWALWMFAAAIFQTLVSGAALLLLIMDLKQNRRSADAQLRAYLGVVAVEVHDKNCIIVKITNFGQIPSSQVVMTTYHQIDNVGEMTELTHNFGMIDPGQSIPGLISHANCSLVIPDDVQRIRVHIVIEYSDGMGKRWCRRAKFGLPHPTGKFPWDMRVIGDTASEERIS